MVKFTKAALGVIFLWLLLAFPSQVRAQQDAVLEVTGKVTDKDGAPIIGASVVIVGTTRGVSTDLSGYMRLR